MRRSWRSRPVGSMSPTTAPRRTPTSPPRRELEEETGLRARTWRKLGVFYTAPGFTDELMHLYLATDLEPAAEDGRLGPDEDERLILEWRPWQDAVAAADRGEIRDAKSIVGLFWLERLRRGQDAAGTAASAEAAGDRRLADHQGLGDGDVPDDDGRGPPRDRRTVTSLEDRAPLRGADGGPRDRAGHEWRSREPRLPGPGSCDRDRLVRRAVRVVDVPQAAGPRRGRHDPDHGRRWDRRGERLRQGTDRLVDVPARSTTSPTASCSTRPRASAWSCPSERSPTRSSPWSTASSIATACCRPALGASASGSGRARVRPGRSVRARPRSWGRPGRGSGSRAAGAARTAGARGRRDTAASPGSAPRPGGGGCPPRHAAPAA